MFHACGERQGRSVDCGWSGVLQEATAALRHWVCCPSQPAPLLTMPAAAPPGSTPSALCGLSWLTLTASWMEGERAEGATCMSLHQGPYLMGVWVGFSPFSLEFSLCFDFSLFFSNVIVGGPECDPHQPLAAQVLCALWGRLWLVLDGRRRRVCEATPPLPRPPPEIWTQHPTTTSPNPPPRATAKPRAPHGLPCGFPDPVRAAPAPTVSTAHWLSSKLPRAGGDHHDETVHLPARPPAPLLHPPLTPTHTP